jgi:hypothetical protein
MTMQRLTQNHSNLPVTIVQDLHMVNRELHVALRLLYYMGITNEPNAGKGFVEHGIGYNDMAEHDLTWSRMT